MTTMLDPVATLPPSRITAGQKLDPAIQQAALDEFYREGFALVRGVLSADECASLRELTDRLIADEVVGPRIDPLYGTKVLRATQSLHPAFCDMLVREPFLSIAEAVLGKTVGMCGQNVIRSGCGHGISNWHVDDILEFPLPDDVPRHDARIQMLVFWFSFQIALSDIESTDHGPTEIVPRSHYSGRRPPEKTDRPIFEGRPPTPVLCKAGDIYLFNHQTWHRGSINRSDRQRYLMQNQYCRGWGIYRFNAIDANRRLPDEEMEKMSPRLKELMKPTRVGPN